MGCRSTPERAVGSHYSAGQPKTFMGSPSTPGRLTVISGPSGVGKGTLVASLLKRHPGLWLSVSATTRAPRPGDIDGVTYRFLDRERFEAQVQAGGFLEWAEFAGYLYGTPRAPVEDHLAQGRSVLLEIELEGARQVRRSFPEGFQVFIKPPSFEELERRIRGRGTEREEAIQRRLGRAHQELEAEAEFDAVLVNGDLEVAVAELEAALGLAAG
ncbi:Guanylate kinase [Synechococcus sp. CBW1107]|nr:Guanylate kinase [Synechococcus sp. CBW1107]